MKTIEINISQYSVILENVEAAIPCISIFGSDLKAYSVTGNESTDEVAFTFQTKLVLKKVEENLYESGINFELLKKEW